MIRRLRTVLLASAAALVFLPGIAFAQVGNIAGTVRDTQGGVLPGVTVEVSSPQLIEKVRSTVTDGNGRYQIVSLPAGRYKVTFRLEKFATVERTNIELGSDFTASVNADMKLGAQTEVVTVTGSAAELVDVQNARQRQVITNEELKELPITHNLNSLINLVPGIAVATAGFSGNSVPAICSGGMADGAAGSFNTSGALSGCSPILGSFNAHASMNDTDSLNQGRMQIDGLGIQSFGGGGRSSYIADIGNAQEVSFTLSGSLGESETGGTTINIVPRTGGNRYSGNFFTAYSNGHFFGKNNDSRPTAFTNRLDSEYDVNGSYGGPIVRDRLWFYGSARRQERNSLLTTAFRNVNQGIFGANYKLSDEHVYQSDLYQNASMRLTLQATRRDKFNVFWDEQYTCENPCHGTVGSPTSVEAQGSLLTHPLHVAQLSWTNPFTNKILLDAGFSHYGSHRDETRNLGEPAYPAIPRITESGSTANVAAGGANPITSGSINNATYWNIDNFQSRASASYVTGSHNVKLGYQGQYLSRVSTPRYNDMRLLYSYATPAANCTNTAPASGSVTAATPAWCGLYPGGATRLYDGLPVGSAQGLPIDTGFRPPVPTSVTEYIPAGSDEHGWFAAIYLQDQWTWNRFTFSGALRYDNAQSGFGKTCVGPDLYTDYPYCLNDPANGDNGKGVYFQDLTPRWGVAWDVFGNGKTALKYSMGKYLDGSQINIGSIYVASNPASGGRTVNSYTRVWRDLDGDRVVDCDLKIPASAPAAGSSLPTNGECGPEVIPFGGQANARRFGRSPDDLDELGLAIGLNTIYCGQDERSMSQLVRNYCNNYMAAGGKNLLSGWNRRRYEWQLSIGVQHEVLPRFSAEVTYNRRQQGNQTVTDLVGSGCDLYSSSADPAVTVNPQQCMNDLFNYNSTYYDFYGVQAPSDLNLPGGGNYVVPGFATLKQTGTTTAADGTVSPVYIAAPAASVNAVTIAPKGSNIDYWSGVDTNFTLRAKRGIRITGGTSTGRRVANTCALQVNDPPTGQQLREGRERLCDAVRPFQTNLRGTASYTIPWVDVLFSSVFTYRPGVTVNANYTVAVNDVVWANTAGRLVPGISGAINGQVTQNLLSNDTYGEGIRIVDIKLAKNIRFSNKRINIGADVYNVFNSDAALGYCGTYPNPSQGIQGCGSASLGTLVPWRAVNNITTPRYARFQLQVDF